jgi:uncharacterized membrane protein YphA (DoxX/SURF4 family)
MQYSSITLVVYIIQIIIALGLLNVWLVRFRSATQYRGGKAQNMSQEFAAYGLPQWSMYVVGALKITIAGILIAGVFAPAMVGMATWWALAVLAVLMMGALVMHARVGDSALKSMPAGIMLILAITAMFIG